MFAVFFVSFVCLQRSKTVRQPNRGLHFVWGQESEREREAQGIYDRGKIKALLSLGFIGLWRHACKRIILFEEGEEQNVMLRSGAACKSPVHMN